MDKNSKIYIAGHTGMVGSAILRKLQSKGYTNFLTRSHAELDLLDQKAVEEFFKQEGPKYVFLAAAKVGGIMANNTYRAQFIYENIQIQNNIIHQSYLNKVKKLLFLGSSCIYPKNAPQPIKEGFLLTGELEYTNEPYAIAKIAGLKMCDAYNIQYGTNFISVMPTNLYGLGDNYDLEKSHVVAAFIRKFHLAKCLENNNWDGIRHDLNKRPIERIDGNVTESEILETLNKYGIQCSSSPDRSIAPSSPRPIAPLHPRSVSLTLWGTGQPRREFLHVDNLAEVCIKIMEDVNFSNLTYEKQKEIQNTHINIGCGEDLMIKELAEMIADIIGFQGKIKWDIEKPDGTPKKLLDVNKMKELGWNNNMPLKNGLEKNYKDYLEGIG